MASRSSSASITFDDIGDVGLERDRLGANRCARSPTPVSVTAKARWPAATERRQHPLPAPGAVPGAVDQDEVGHRSRLRSRRLRAAPRSRPASKPNSASTASVSAPSSGGARRYCTGVADSFIGLATSRTRAGERMRHLDRHAARAHLRVGEHLGQVVDRPARHLGRFERAPASRLRARRFIIGREQRHQRSARLRTRSGVAREARVARQVGAAGDLAELARTGRRCRRPGSCGRRRPRTPGTARCSGARCRRAAARRRSPGSSAPRLASIATWRVEQRHVDRLALAGAVAVAQRGEDRGRSRTCR